jgi:hypothetical protein
MTRYVTNGAGVCAPSENLGYYFSGLRAADWGLIQAGDNSTNTTANTLISVDMSVMRNETWANNTLPNNIPGRVNAELVWIPVSEKGVLIAIGGVTNSASLTATGVLPQAKAATSVCLLPRNHLAQFLPYIYMHRTKPALPLWRLSLSMTLPTTNGSELITSLQLKCADKAKSGICKTRLAIFHLN